MYFKSEAWFCKLLQLEKFLNIIAIVYRQKYTYTVNSKNYAEILSIFLLINIEKNVKIPFIYNKLWIQHWGSTYCTGTVQLVLVDYHHCWLIRTENSNKLIKVNSTSIACYSVWYWLEAVLLKPLKLMT